MKKLFYFAAAAVALAACAKNEVIPVNSGENQEITFNVAPKTKADLQTFNTGNVFASWAYYLPKNKTWDANYAVYKSKSVDQNWKPEEDKDYTVPQEYISGATIANNTNTGGKWKCATKTFYWPKDGGKLTFFAYSLNKGDFTLTGDHSGFGCDPSFGISGAIDLQANPNTDFLVAEIAKDKTSNEQIYSTDGVPTLFKHRLSSVVFAIRTGANYTDKKFELTNITLHNLYHYATYGQLPNEKFHPSASGNEPYIPIYTSTPQPIKFQDDFVNVTGVDKDIFIPQDFANGSNATANAYIEVKYTITTKVGTNGDGTDKVVKEQVTKQIFLNPENGKGTKMFDKWEMGKKYTINLTFTLDEILWAPAVQNWEDGTTAGQTVA